jgi:FixJ family two-component response regulator
MQSKPTVFVVDDDPDMRGALRYLIEGVGLDVVEFENGRAFLDGYDHRRPACLVLDMRMPGMGGLELQDELVAQDVDLPVIMLTGYGDVPSAVRALKSGVVDFIEKPFNNQDVLDKIQRSLEADAQRQQERERRDEIRGRIERLTAREREVMELVVSGKFNKEIAHELKISIKTVEIHRARVMEKTRTTNVAELLNLVKSVKS